MTDGDTPEPITTAPANLLLAGIVGSTAYGMSRPGSDIDRLGMFAAPTELFHGLNLPIGKRATHKRTDVDATYHEAGKYVSLLLAGNPTVSELLWLPDDLYETRTDLGRQLLEIRAAFVSQRCKDTYLGYATAQFKRLVDKGRFPDVPVDRIRKHARHLLRLVDAGTHLWVTGELQVRVLSPRKYFDFADRVVEDPEHARGALAQAEYTFSHCPTPLPASPDVDAAEYWLHTVRDHYYTWGEDRG